MYSMVLTWLEMVCYYVVEGANVPKMKKPFGAVTPRGLFVGTSLPRGLHPHHIVNMRNVSNILSKYFRDICDILARLLPPVTHLKEIAVEQQTVMTDEEPPSSSVESFPILAFGYGTPSYLAFLEALIDGLLEYEYSKGRLAYGPQPLPAA
jgi:hypothetical protein